MRNILFILLLSLSISANADNLGVWGDVFPILEEDLLSVLEAKVRRLVQNGQWQAIEARFKDTVEKSINNPEGLNLPRARTDRTFTFDPSIEILDAVYDTHDLQIVKKGTRVNPLDVVPFNKTLLFIDASDKDMLAWAKVELEQSISPLLILTKGSPKEASSLLDVAVYFDFKGVLVKRFGIKALPARVTRTGSMLKIEEVA